MATANLKKYRILDRDHFKFSKNGMTLIALFFILWFAFAIRISWVIFIEPLHADIGYDGVRYDQIATNLLNKEGFGYYPNTPSSWRPPGYPFFLYAIYALFGHSIFVARIMQCLLGTAICLILFLLTKKLTRDMPHGEKIALLAAFLYAVDYYSIVIIQALYTELFSSLLIILSIYLFYSADQASPQKTNILFFLASVILWHATLTRPANILFWAWVGIWFFLENRKDLKRVLRAFLIVLFTFCMTVLPWTIRNHNLHKKFLLVSSNGGFIFFMAHHPHSEGGFIPEGPLRYTPQQEEELKGLNEIDSQKKHFQYGLDWIRKNPARELHLILLKQKHLWAHPESPYVFYDFLSYLPFPLTTFHLLSIFFIPGLYYSWKYCKPFFLPLAYILNHSLIISFIYFYDGPRMRIELLPPLTIFASIGIINLLTSPIKTLTRKLTGTNNPFYGHPHSFPRIKKT